MPITTYPSRAAYDLANIKVGWVRHVLAGEFADPAEVTAVNDDTVVIDRIDDFGVRHPQVVLRTVEAFEATFIRDIDSQWATEQCRIPNCHGRRDLGDGNRCIRHRQVTIGWATLTEELTGVDINDQRDIPHADSRSWKIDAGQRQPLVVGATFTRGGALQSNATVGVTFEGEVVTDHNYSGVWMPIAAGGHSHVSATQDTRVGQSYHQTFRWAVRDLVGAITGEVPVRQPVTFELADRFTPGEFTLDVR